MAKKNKVTLRLFRYDPETDQEPRYETYEVPPKKYMRILDAINQMYDESGEGMAYRWYCGIKRCGECAITVNGRPILSCWEPAEGELTCEPLANFPIIRDLAVDMSQYEKIILGLIPFIRRPRTPSFPEKLPHTRMARPHRLSACLECNVCTAAVPVNAVTQDGIQWDGAVGPAALVKFARFALDPRDKMDRTALAERSGLREFPLYRDLESICPQGIKILEDAIIPLKQRFFGASDGGRRENDSTAVFIKAKEWSAFVRLSPQQKESLINEGRLKKLELSSLPEAYSLEK